MTKKSPQTHMKKLFTEGFTAIDIAQPLFSFDGDKNVKDIIPAIAENELEVIGVNIHGRIKGYIICANMSSGTCAENMTGFAEDDILLETSPLSEVINILEEAESCFVSTLGTVTAVITRTDIQKPPVRMWLFGLITIIEMYIARMINERFPGISWHDHVPHKRLQIAEELQAERRKRGQHVKLLDCLQLSDKASILTRDPEILKELGFESRNAAKKRVWELLSLRNSLAHAHDIVSYDFQAIVRTSKGLDNIIDRI